MTKNNRFLTYFSENAKLKTKFLASHLIFVLIPLLLFASFLFTQISDVLVSNTIRTEESLIDQMDTSISAITTKISAIPGDIREQDFFINTLRSTNHMEYRKTPDYYAEATSFFSYIYSTEGANHVRDIKIYVDEPRNFLMEDYPDSRIFLPIDEITGSYWYGIFSSSDQASLFCPKFYLSPSEIANIADTAYIHKVDYISAPQTVLPTFSIADSPLLPTPMHPWQDFIL